MLFQGSLFQFALEGHGIPSTLSSIHIIVKGHSLQIGHLNYHEMGILALVRSNDGNTPFTNVTK